MALSTIKIPEKVYVGFQGRRSQDEVPLGFMTPYTTDAAGQKRRDSVDRWAKGYGHNKTFNSVIMENKPMVGFRIGRAIRRSGGWNGSGASYIRIEDPRGFELEITIENLAMCMNGNIIEDGEIMQSCVWGRDGNRNILLPINSDPYKDSVTTKVALENKLSLRDIKTGDKIKLLTGEEGIYLGSMYPYTTERYCYHDKKMEVGTKRYVMKYTDRKGTISYVGYSSLKVGEVLEAAPAKLTPAQIEQMVLADYKNDPKNLELFKDNSSYHVVRFFLTSNEHQIVKTDQVTVTETEIKNDYTFFEVATIIAENNSNKYLMASAYHNFNEDRNRSNRGYYSHQYTSSGYYNHNSTWVGTNGYIGEEVSFGPASITRSRHSETHFEVADTKRLFYVKLEVQSKNGELFDFIL